ncbi:MAG: flagellar basal body P-ring formation chaperone FlgA [Holosporales bacterium]
MKAAFFSMISLILWIPTVGGVGQEKSLTSFQKMVLPITPWDQMIQFLTQHLEEHLGQSLRLRVLEKEAFQNFQGFSGLTLQNLDFNPHNKKFTAHLLLESLDHQTVSSFDLHGQVIFLRKIPVFKEGLEGGEECALEKIRWQLMEESRFLKDVVTDPELLKGARARHAILAGEFPSRKNLKTPDLVEKGEAVELFYQRGPLVITLAGGHALTKGRLGETISVLNPLKGKSAPPLWGVVEKNRRIRLNALS